MDGVKDDFAIWNRALTDEELQGLFESGLNGLSIGQLILPSESLFGDYNDDDKVDAADFTVWRDNLGASITLTNESVTPGMVTQEDYVVWKTNFGMMAGGGGLSGVQVGVPEPGTVLLLVAGLIGVLTFCRGRWHRAQQKI